MKVAKVERSNFITIMTLSGMVFVRYLLPVLLAGSRSIAQTVTPFVIDGLLQGYVYTELVRHIVIRISGTATSATQFNSGGSLIVGGTSITIPENLQVQFPATFVPYRDFAANINQYNGFEVNVEGNYVSITT